MHRELASVCQATLHEAGATLADASVCRKAPAHRPARGRAPRPERAPVEPPDVRLCRMSAIVAPQAHKRRLGEVGQPVIEQTLDIATGDGAMETFLCRPERNLPVPAVLMLMDAPGIREELRDMARRLATVGYCVLLPNLYYRAGRDTLFGADVLDEGSDEWRRMRAIRTKMTIPPVMRDVAAMLAFLDAEEAVKPGPVGCHGYCMSGPYALAAAARYPERIAAAASFYGTWLVSDAEESPHRNLAGIRGEAYIACAEHDDLAPLPMVRELETLFAAAGTRGEIEIHPGVQHGFAFPARRCYDRPAAERHWERLIALYRRNLG